MTSANANILVVVGDALASSASAEAKARVVAAVDGLRAALGFVTRASEVEFRVDPKMRDAGFEVTIDGERAWAADTSTTLADATPRRLADRIAAVLFDNRQALLLAGFAPTEAVPTHFAESHARACARTCRRRKIELDVPIDNDWVERQLWSAADLRLTLHIASSVDETGWFGDPNGPRPIQEVADIVQDAVWGEDGFLIPPLKIDRDETLDRSELRITINDVVFPPMAGLAHDELWVDNESGGGRRRDNPVTGAPGRVVPRTAKPDGSRLVFDHLGIAVLEVIRAVRRNAGAFLCGELVAADLDALERRAPVLTRAARSQLGERRITSVLRQLVAERIQVANRIEILDAMLCYQGETTVPLERRMLIVAEPGAWTPAVGDSPSDPDRGMIEAVRDRLSLRIRRQHTGLYGVIQAVTMDSKWEARLARPERLEDAEHARLMSSLANALGDTHSVGPVVLTQKAVRRTLRDEIAVAFPDVAVIAFSELNATESPQVIGRVKWVD